MRRKDWIFIIAWIRLIRISDAILCPLEIKSFTDPSCSIDSSNDPSVTHESIDISSINQSESPCQFILDGLFRITSCDNDILKLDPCFLPNPFASSKSISLNTCFYNPTPHDNTRGAYSSIIGSCLDVNEEEASCLSTLEPTMSASPTEAPTPDSDNLKGWIELPSLPLPANVFADQPLDVNLAHEVVYLTGRLIYTITDEESAKDLLLSTDYTFHLWKDTGSTEVLVVSTNHTEDHVGKIMVAFRGTDETPDGDWLTNINLPKVRYGPKNAILDGEVKTQNMFGFDTISNIRVHKGFNGVFSDNLYEIVMEVVEPLLSKTNDDGDLYYNNTVHFAGHSLGGANAQVFGTYFAFFHPQVDTFITTLGAPRQGNIAYKTLVESLPNLSVWRMVNCRDIVPRVPNVGYYHAGHLIWKRCNPPSDEKLPNDVVEAYYRHTGDSEQGYARTPPEYIVNSIESTMIGDHFGYAYLEWLSFSQFTGGNWTADFVRTI